MATPRVEFYKKVQGGETHIRDATSEFDTENKIDHYAVLSQVINEGVERYLSNPDYHSTLVNTHYVPHLDANLQADMIEVMVATLKDAEFSDHHTSLVRSATQRSSLNKLLYSDIDKNIEGGVKTFIAATSHLFDILKSRLGPEAAGNEKNWPILDKLAKLNITAFLAYYRTYFVVHENRTEFINQIERNEDGSYKFKLGYPTHAPVNVASTSESPSDQVSSRLILNEDNPKILLKDIELNQATVGCPITFDSSVIKKLWGVYSTHAYHLVTTPAISSGDTEASHQ